ncbi:MAG: ATP-binding protein [Clostridia bacterium]|nr:ATP-binding protein [Clostridia bacterium]
MLFRKITKKLEQYYADATKRALLVTGARQVGKSFAIEHFADSHYDNWIKIDFIENSDYIELIRSARGADEILLRLSVDFGDRLIPGKTMIFFDEVQKCPEIITQIKYLVYEGSYQYILSGSLLGTVLKDIISVPVGYMDVIRMFPLDVEEFAIANGVGVKVIDNLRRSFAERTPIDSYIHNRMTELFELYLIVGGMPAAVSEYLETKNLRRVSSVQNGIITLYRHEITKYNENSRLQINEIFDLIPGELNSKNKRFILKNLNEKARFDMYYDSFLWLKNAGVALTANVADEPKAPLVLSKSQNLFKLFSNDVGLLAAQYGNGLQLDILKHNTNINFGSIYENAAAEELTAHGYDLYYYNSKKFGEVDFLIEDHGQVIPLEIKSGKDYYRHNAMDNLLGIADYELDEGFVFCNSNVEIREILHGKKIIYFPIYMLMFMQKQEIPDDIIFEADFSDLH